VTIPAKWRDPASLQYQMAQAINPVLQGYVMPRYSDEPDAADGQFYFDLAGSVPKWSDGTNWYSVIGVDASGNVTLGASRTPASASDTGTAGTLCWDSSYIYVCTATDTWKRVAIATW